jgi:site-specific recombinase XerD
VLQIDFNEKDETGNHKIKMIHQVYRFNLENELSKHPTKELNEPATKERLMQSLERDNLHEVTFVRGDREDKCSSKRIRSSRPEPV